MIGAAGKRKAKPNLRPRARRTQSGRTASQHDNRCGTAIQVATGCSRATIAKIAKSVKLAV